MFQLTESISNSDSESVPAESSIVDSLAKQTSKETNVAHSIEQLPPLNGQLSVDSSSTSEASDSADDGFPR